MTLCWTCAVILVVCVVISILSSQTANVTYYRITLQDGIYLVSSSPVANSTTAVQACEDVHGHLVYFNNDAEFFAFSDKISTYSYFRAMRLLIDVRRDGVYPDYTYWWKNNQSISDSVWFSNGTHQVEPNFFGCPLECCYKMSAYWYLGDAGTHWSTKHRLIDTSCNESSTFVCSQNFPGSTADLQIEDGGERIRVGCVPSQWFTCCNREYRHAIGVLSISSVTTNGFQDGVEAGYIKGPSRRYHSKSSAEENAGDFGAGQRAVAVFVDLTAASTQAASTHSSTYSDGDEVAEAFIHEHGPTICADPSQCGEHTCVELSITDYRCDCELGYRLAADGHACFDIDECQEGTASCADLCENTNGSYVCACQQGYTLASDGLGCDVVDECGNRSNGRRSQNCTESISGSNSSCDAGYFLADDNTTCHDIDECQEGTASCADICENTNGSYVCACQQGYTLAPDGLGCKANSIAPTNKCPCRCGSYAYALRAATPISPLPPLMGPELLVERETLSKTLRTHTSMYEDTPTRVFLGSSALIFVSVLMATIAMRDVTQYFFRHRKSARAKNVQGNGGMRMRETTTTTNNTFCQKRSSWVETEHGLG